MRMTAVFGQLAHNHLLEYNLASGGCSVRSIVQKCGLGLAKGKLSGHQASIRELAFFPVLALTLSP